MSTCSKDGWCPAMSARLNDSSGAGMSVLNLMNFKTGEESIGGVLFKRDRRDRGIMLNVCPWCAAPIMWIKIERKTEGADTPGRHETERTELT